MRHLAWLFAAAAGGAAIGGVTTATARGPFTERAVVVRALAGDSLLVRLPSGKQERVRVLGVSAPAGGECHGAQSLARIRAVAGRKRVTLVGDGTSRARDRSRRLLAYVRLPDR